MKNIIIMGDSYSTYKDCIPSGFRHYYGKRDRDENHFAEKFKLEETWWYQTVEKLGLNLVQNNSWSGSTICYTGYDNLDASNVNSFIYRFNNLLKEDFFNKNQIDTMLVFGGTNDSWVGGPLGEMMFENWQKSDLYAVKPAICYFMHLLKENIPKVEVHFIINTDLREEVVSCIIDACNHYNYKYLSLENIDKVEGHPTVLGMKQIYEQVVSYLVVI